MSCDRGEGAIRGVTAGRPKAAPVRPAQSVWECSHLADIPSPSILKHLLKGEGGAAEWQSRPTLHQPDQQVPECVGVQERGVERTPGEEPLRIVQLLHGRSFHHLPFESLGIFQHSLPTRSGRPPSPSPRGPREECQKSGSAGSGYLQGNRPNERRQNHCADTAPNRVAQCNAIGNDYSTIATSTTRRRPLF